MLLGQNVSIGLEDSTRESDRHSDGEMLYYVVGGPLDRHRSGSGSHLAGPN